MCSGNTHITYNNFISFTIVLPLTHIALYVIFINFIVKYFNLIYIERRAISTVKEFVPLFELFTTPDHVNLKS